MNIIELLKIALSQLRANKLRSFLTTLGILLGVWFVISIAAIMETFTNSMVETTQGLGADVFQVDRYPRTRNNSQKREFYPKIKIETAQRIMERCPNVLIASAEDSKGGVAVKYGDKETNNVINMYGAQPGWSLNNNWPLEKGREVNESDNISHRNVVVIGYDVVNELFNGIEPVGQKVVIEGRRFTVIGVIEEQGNQMGNSRNNIIAIPITTLHDIHGEMGVRITIRSTSIENRDEAIEEVRHQMRLVNKAEPGDPDSFGSWNNESNSADMVSFFNYVKIGGIVLGLIALIVGGIGVMNIMLATVKERTREIGVRKSLGAKRTTILLQFLYESSVLCLIGAFIGIGAGLATGLLFSFILDTSMGVPVTDIVIAVVSTALIGVGFGSYPAWKAAKLDPIEALRYE